MIKSIYIFALLTIFIACSPHKKTTLETTPQKEIVSIKTDSIDNNSISNQLSPPRKAHEILKNSYDTEVDDRYRGNESLEKIDHTIFDQLLNNNVSEDGNVNYNGFIKNRTVFKEYLKTLETHLPDDSWTHHDKLAYWMNVYNAFTIKLIIDHYPTNSIKDIKDPWDSRFFKLGSKWYNLNEVEHQILRKMGDARIHFGINCASFSCPPLLNKAFTAANVNNELERLAKKFINDPLRNKISADNIQLSKIFQWFGKDFKTEGSLIDFLNKYSDTKIKPNAKKSYLKYNWDLNE